MKRISAFIVALLMVFVISGCSSVSTEPDQVALHYSGGSFSSKNFVDCVEASDRQYDGPGDQHYVYPKGQRTFSFTGAQGSESTPISVTTGNQEVGIPGFLTFTLNTDCKVLQEFHEKVGFKYKAYEGGGGWASFLNDYIAVPLNQTLNDAAGSITPPNRTDGKPLPREQNWQALYSNPETQKQFEDYVKDNLPTEIEKTLGEKFISVNAVSIAKPQISDGLKESLSKAEKARLDNEAQAEQNATILTKYATISDCLATGLDKQSCTIIYLAENGANIPFLPVPQGGAVNFTPAQ